MSDSRLENPNWIPLTRALMPSSVRNNFESEFLNGTSLRNWVVDEFEKQCGTQFEPQVWDQDALSKFRQWWWFQLEHGEFMHRKRPKLESVLHSSLSSKAWALAQRHCPVCSGLLPSEAQFPISIMPLRLAPKSRQVMGSVVWGSFQKAVKTWFDKRTINLGPTGHFCIAITFVLAVDRNDRDLDNMTKAVMDAFSRALEFNDRDIHHLDVLKLRGDAPEEYMIIRLAPSYLSDNSTVMLPLYDGKFGVGDALNLSDFI